MSLAGSSFVEHRPHHLIGGMEHLLLGGTPREASLLELLQRSFASFA
jgi:hypothetical protein